MNRQEKRRIQKLEQWVNSLSSDKQMIIEQTVSNRTEKRVWALNQAIDTSIAAALSDLHNLSIKEIEEVLKLTNSYLKDSEEFLRKNGENWIMELKKIEPQIKKRIKELRKAGVLKSRGLVELKKEFDVPAKDLDNFWLEVKEEFNVEVSTNTLNDPVKEAKGKKVEKIKIEEPKVEIKKENKLKVLKATIEGQYGTYEKEGTTVKIGDLVFRNEQDVEDYKHREMARFMAELTEILDVMLMGV